MVGVMEGRMNILDVTQKKNDNVYKGILKERISTYDTSSLLPEDMLSTLTGIDIALIKKSIDEYGITELSKYLMAMPLSKAQRRKLEMVYAFSKKLSLADFKEKVVLDSSTKAGEYCVKLMQGLAEENFVVLCLDSRNRLISEADFTSKGTINEAPVYIRNIVQLILNKNANAVIICHNHLAGSLNFSPQDVEVSRKLASALNTVGIKLIDHILVAENRYISFAERGLF